jgi:hypothetical protein
LGLATAKVIATPRELVARGGLQPHNGTEIAVTLKVGQPTRKPRSHFPATAAYLKGPEGQGLIARLEIN